MEGIVVTGPSVLGLTMPAGVTCGTGRKIENPIPNIVLDECAEYAIQLNFIVNMNQANFSEKMEFENKWKEIKKFFNDREEKIVWLFEGENPNMKSFIRVEKHLVRHLWYMLYGNPNASLVKREKNGGIFKNLL